MKYAVCLLVAGAMYAQEMPKSAAALTDSSGKSVMVIDPKARSSDIAQAFDLLRKDRPTQKMMIRTPNSELMNITDVTASSSGTLLFVKVLSSQGTRTVVVPVEQIMEIGYSP